MLVQISFTILLCFLLIGCQTDPSPRQELVTRLHDSPGEPLNSATSTPHSSLAAQENWSQNTQKTSAQATSFSTSTSLTNQNISYFPDSNLLLTVASYQGKYQKYEAWKKIAAAVPSIADQTLEKIAKITGLVYQKRGKILVVFRDWNRQEARESSILRSVQQGQEFWEIRLITEHLLSRQENIEVVLPKLIMAAIVQQYNPQNSLPDWLKLGAISYTTTPENILLDQYSLRLLDEQKTASEVLQGLAFPSPLYPELEGHLGFQFIAQFYSDGHDKIQTLLDQILWQGKDWEKTWQNVLGMEFIIWQDQSQRFSIAKLEKHNRTATLAYRRALKLYLQEDYPSAIPEFQKLTLEWRTTFLSGNLEFWLGMCYYRLKQYATALEYYQRALDMPDSLQYIVEARYRAALCDYHQTHLAQAAVSLEEFIRDFPQEELQASAYFFLAQCREQQKENRLALQHYETLARQFPQHPRALAAYLAASSLAKQLGWFQSARLYDTAALTHEKITPQEKQQVEEDLALLLEIEKRPIPEFLASLCEDWMNFAQQPLERQQEILKEFGRIGLLALPWYERTLNQLSASHLPSILESLGPIQHPSTAPLWLKIITQFPESKEAWIALFSLHIPLRFLDDLIQQNTTGLPEKQRAAVINQWNKLQWKVTPEMLDKLPNLLVQLNQNASTQQQAVEQMTMHCGEEQIPTLWQLAMHGHPPVRLQALEQLLVRQDAESISIFQQLAQDSNSQIQILAIQGLFGLQQYADVIAAFKSPDQNVRDSAKKLLSQLQPHPILSVLARSFLVEQQPEYYYTTIVELLELHSQTRLQFTPSMSLEQRRQLVAKYLEK